MELYSIRIENDIDGKNLWLYAVLLEAKETLTFRCSIDVPNIAMAALLRNALAAAIDTRLKTIRETAYLAGWADAKTKHRKATNFDLSWYNVDPE